MNERIAFFGYNWDSKIALSAYMNEIVTAFLNFGFDIDVYLGNKLAKDFGVYGIREDISIKAVNEFICQKNYLFIVSFNNSMLTPEIIYMLKGKIISVIVDEVEHLFNHKFLDLYDIFNYEIEFVIMSSTLQKSIVRKIPAAARRIHLIPPATNIKSKNEEGIYSDYLYEISWIASLLVPDFSKERKTISNFLDLAADNPQIYKLIQFMIEVIATKGDLKSLDSDGIKVVAEFAKVNFGWPLHILEFELNNIITNRKRVEITELLEPLGLKLFGNKSWRNLLVSNKKIYSALQPGAVIDSHKHLEDIYNRSKISINIPQHHVAPEAIQFRVPDIMTSKSLLITKADKNSDLYLFYGKNCPVPIFRSNNELKKLCSHFLKNEIERKFLVDECNKIITEEFSFEQQCRNLLSICNINYRIKNPSIDFTFIKGEIEFMNLSLISKDYFQN